MSNIRSLCIKFYTLFLTGASDGDANDMVSRVSPQADWAPSGKRLAKLNEWMLRTGRKAQ
ncbi:hypothetical protein SEN777SA01_38200 [Salmonella enterica subsp. enterica serovar Agona]|nr:hypothetical protein SEN47SA97_38670 [Salmonella enterica subsp. enterica serovar Agona]CAH2837488.1 hypothetical protein SEN777SA01_38200 [Salmonella enterica subsp. enterica serovar Agona]CAH2838096.1 hypothetical protein SEN1169SA97_37470 [Salmonella enterica subsp. enterica serovar Agona]